MGCDIHPIAEVRKEGKWTAVTADVFPFSEWDRKYYKKDGGSAPFDWRSYSMFAFLAGVRNLDHCEPLSEPRGIPDDASEEAKELEAFWECNGHSHSYVTLQELLAFDYDKTFGNRRVTKQVGPNAWSGGELAEEGEGEIVTYRENLGPHFFAHLEALKALGEPQDVRVVFLFDN